MSATAKSNGKTTVKWSEKRIAVVKAMRKLGAVGVMTGQTAEEIAKKANFENLEAVGVKVICDAYRERELIHQGFVQSARVEDCRELVYYLTRNGQRTKFGVRN